jgi:hypothetical protein
MNTGNLIYQIYQAERTKSAAEQRRIDDHKGELAAAISRRWRRIIAPLRSLRRPAYPAQGRPAEPGRPQPKLAEGALAEEGVPAAART